MSEDPRHKLPDRLFHWIMALLVMILLGTAFLPILGIKFNWVTTHWIAGVFLIIATIFHLYRSFWVHGITEMLPTRADLKFKHSTDQKYDLNQKLYHWSVASIMIVLLVTGSVMLAKVDTPIWNRDPSILSDWNWGIVYLLHGAASLLLIFFLILHIYFAFLPEHRDLLRSMVFGKSNPKNNDHLGLKND